MKKSLMAFAMIVALAATTLPAFASSGQAPPGAYAAQGHKPTTTSADIRQPASSVISTPDGKGFAFVPVGVGIPTLWRPLAQAKDPPISTVEFALAGGAHMSSPLTVLGEPPGSGRSL